MDSEHDGDGAGEDLSGDEARLKSIEAPNAPSLPPPPEIHFQRPAFGQARRVDGDFKTTVKIGKDRPSHAAPKKDSHVPSAASVGAGFGASVTFAASVIVGVIIGQWVDRKFGWANGGIPWGTIVFVLAGLAAGFVNLFRLLSIGSGGNRKD